MMKTRSLNISSGIMKPTTVILIFVFIGLSFIGSGEAANAAYVFGDSFVDTANAGNEFAPYGMTWPGYPSGRASDGRNQADYFAEVFGVPSPIPYQQLKNDSQSVLGVNFGRGGGSVMYAYGHTPLALQVDQLEALLDKGVLTRDYLSNSVALVSIGVNDYGSRNLHGIFQVSAESEELKTFITNVVDGITSNIVRLHRLGIRNIVVANLANMPCSPYVTVDSNFTTCSNNSTITTENSNHNALLEKRMDLLRFELLGANIVILDQTKAFNLLFHNGTNFGFVDPLTPCCYGKDPLDAFACGSKDSEGQPLYTVCEDPTKSVIFDGIHPTQEAWRILYNLYAFGTEFTLGAPNLRSWIRQYNI
ncbi:hypothetical protein M758_5G191900 [Ceratodon purpureus]|nr:hypothetical protein M758_5G191900 [Ceratodon purpureus]